jgi:hypothetical protein
LAGIALIQSFLQQANARGSRSTALQPLQWGIAMVLGAFLVASYERASLWILETLGVFAALLILSFVGSYFFLLFKDRDALRSERFHLSKMAMERSIIGDNLAGFLEPEKQPLLFPSPESKSNEE